MLVLEIRPFCGAIDRSLKTAVLWRRSDTSVNSPSAVIGIYSMALERSCPIRLLRRN